MQSLLAIADPTRRRIVELLATRDRTSGELVEEFDLSVVNATGSITEQQRTYRKLVSQHLEIEHDDEQLDDIA